MDGWMDGCDTDRSAGNDDDDDDDHTSDGEEWDDRDITIRGEISNDDGDDSVGVPRRIDEICIW